jgi:hypothetical protein
MGMGGLIIILPILAFDVWLCATTGTRQMRHWAALGQWRRIAAALCIGAALGVWMVFFAHYRAGMEIRRGFPIPLSFFRAEENVWIRAALPAPVACAGYAANFLTGLAAPFIPGKIGEFLKQVKAELK